MPLWIILTKWPAPPDGFQNRFEPLDDLLFAADHQTVADLEPPDAAAGAGVDEVQALWFEFFGAPDRILVIGIAAVDDDVAFGEDWQQLLDGLIDGVARRYHQPDGARRTQLIGEIRQGTGPQGAPVDDPLDRLAAAVIGNHPMAAQHQPLGHIGSHAAKPDHS